jgi:hypothetical protein
MLSRARLCAFRLAAEAQAAVRDPVVAYLYEETRQLVRLVESAAARVEAAGEGPWPSLARRVPADSTSTIIFSSTTRAECVRFPSDFAEFGRPGPERLSRFFRQTGHQAHELAVRPEPAAAE